MGTKRSGRRKIEIPDGLELPELGDTEDSVRLYLFAVAQHVAAGRLDPRVADSIVCAVKAGLKAIGDGLKRTKIAQLKALVERAEAVNRAGLAHEAADRHGVASATRNGNGPDPADRGPAKD